MAAASNRRRRELESRLIEQAVKDEAFRRALVADPRGTLERELGVPIAAAFSLTVLEETPTRHYLVLPPAPSRGDSELSDRELDAVAGGAGAYYTAGDYCTAYVQADGSCRF